MSFTNLNYLAIILAAVAGFAVSGVWYTFLFAKQWMDAHGTTEAKIKARGGPSPMPFVIAGIANVVMAAVLSALLHGLGALSFGNAIWVAILIWLGFMLTTTMLVNNTFGFRRPMLTVIDGGNWLAVSVVMALIIAAFG